MKKIKTLFILLLTVLLGTACSNEQAIDLESGGEYELTIHTRALGNKELDGVVISKIRLLLLDPTAQKVVLNSTTDNGLLVEAASGNIEITVPLGIYNYYMIVNEPVEITQAFRDAQSIDPDFLKRLEILSKEDTYTDANIALQHTGTITISKDLLNPGKALGTTNSSSVAANPVTINLLRTQAKVSLFLRKDDAVTDPVVVQRVEIVETPQSASLFNLLYDYLYFSNPMLYQTFTPYKGPDLPLEEAGATVKDGKNYYDIFQNCIIASKTMTDPNKIKEINATYLMINATYKGTPYTYKVLLSSNSAPGTVDYTIQRGVHYKVYAAITQKGDGITTKIDIKPWEDGGTIDVIEKPAENLFLNVSELSVDTIISKKTDSNRDFTKQIHFNSNKKYEEVSVAQVMIDYYEGSYPNTYTLEEYAQYITDNPFGNTPTIKVSQTQTSETSGAVAITLNIPDRSSADKAVITFYIKVGNIHRKVTVQYTFKSVSA